MVGVFLRIDYSYQTSNLILLKVIQPKYYHLTKPATVTDTPANPPLSVFPKPKHLVLMPNLSCVTVIKIPEETL